MILPRSLSLAAALAGLLLSVHQANAASVAVGNSSFETGDGPGVFSYPNASSTPAANATTGSGTYYEKYDPSASNDTTILGPDWSATASAAGWNLIDVAPTDMTGYNNRFLTAGTSAGPKYAFINLNSTTLATLTTTSAGLNLTIQPLTTYTLTVAIGNPTPIGNTNVYDTVPNEFIQFLANGSALNSTLFPLATVNVSSAPNGTFTDYTATFTTGAVDTGSIFGKALALQMGGEAVKIGSTTITGIGAFDNVRLDVTAVPEPSAWALMLGGAGMLAFGVARRARA